MIDLKNTLLVFLGSAIGGTLRFWIGSFIQTKSNSMFPWSTFTINILGCLLIGIILGFANKNNSSSTNLTLLMATGFCGGFTTFSAFANENIQLLRNNLNTLSFVYIIGSVVLGIAAVKIGLTIIK